MQADPNNQFFPSDMESMATFRLGASKGRWSPTRKPTSGGISCMESKLEPFLSKWNAMTPSEAHSLKVESKPPPE